MMTTQQDKLQRQDEYSRQLRVLEEGINQYPEALAIYRQIQTLWNRKVQLGFPPEARMMRLQLDYTVQIQGLEERLSGYPEAQGIYRQIQQLWTKKMVLGDPGKDYTL